MSSGFPVAVRELAHLPSVWRAPSRPRAQVEARALRATNELLSFCRARVPYYGDPAYARPSLRSLADLAQLPVLTKATVLDAGVDRFRTPGLSPRQYRTDLTSGTTGVRLEIRHDVDAYGYHGATVLRRFLRSGYRPWWRIAQLKGFPRPVRWFQRLGILPRTVVSSGQSEEDIARDVLAVRPHLIMGYPVVLRGLLRALSPDDLVRLRATLRMVMTDSELLTDEVAALLSTGFGVPVFDEYSAYEVLTVSSQCRSGSMHVDEDRVWLEIVDEYGQPVPDGTEGHVTVTHFRERAMPLVRYQLGDRGVIVPGGCACAITHRRMRLTSGRTNDFVTLADGRRVYSGVFLALSIFAAGVAECMVRQDASGKITVLLVPEAHGSTSFDDAATDFRRRFSELVDAPAEFVFQRTDRVDLTPGGKGRFVESAYVPEQG